MPPPPPRRTGLRPSHAAVRAVAALHLHLLVRNSWVPSISQELLWDPPLSPRHDYGHESSLAATTQRSGARSWGETPSRDWGHPQRPRSKRPAARAAPQLPHHELAAHRTPTGSTSNPGRSCSPRPRGEAVLRAQTAALPIWCGE